MAASIPGARNVSDFRGLSAADVKCSHFAPKVYAEIIGDALALLGKS